MAYDNSGDSTYYDSNYWDEYDYYEDGTYYGDAYYDANGYVYYGEDEEVEDDEYYEEADYYPSEEYAGDYGSGSGGGQGGGGLGDSYAINGASRDDDGEIGYSRNYVESGVHGSTFGENMKGRYARGGGGSKGDGIYHSSAADYHYPRGLSREDDWYGVAVPEEDDEGVMDYSGDYEDSQGGYEYAGGGYQDPIYRDQQPGGVADRSSTGGQSWGTNTNAAASDIVGVGAAASFYQDNLRYTNAHRSNFRPSTMNDHSMRQEPVQEESSDNTGPFQHGSEDEQYSLYDVYGEHGQPRGAEAPQRPRSSIRELFFSKIRRRRSTKNSMASPVGTEAEQRSRELGSPTALTHTPLQTSSSGQYNSRPLSQLVVPPVQSAPPAPPQTAAGHTIQARNLLWGSPSPTKPTSGMTLPRLSMPYPTRNSESPLRPIPGAWEEPRSQRQGPEMLGFLAPRD